MMSLSRLLAALCSLWVVGACSRPRAMYPYLGLDVNVQWAHEPAERPWMRHLAREIREGHFSSLRIGVFWNWPDSHMDAMYAWVRTTGVPEILFDVFPAPPGHEPAPWWAAWRHEPVGTAARWRAWARRVIRTHPAVTHWMVGNEPNRARPEEGGDPAMWALIYRVFHEETRAAGVQLVGPALGHDLRGGLSSGEWLRQFFDAGGRVDILGVHPYDHIIRLRWAVGSVLRERGLSDMEVWAVETSGRPGAGPASHLRSLQPYYDRAFFHVVGNWRADRRVKGIDHLILWDRKGSRLVPSPDAEALKALGSEMFKKAAVRRSAMVRPASIGAQVSGSHLGLGPLAGLDVGDHELRLEGA